MENCEARCARWEISAMDQTALIIGGGLLAAWWAGTSAVFEGVKQANEVRDRIVIGNAGGDPLPAEYAWLLVWCDWLPMKLALAAISLMLGVLIVLLPGLAGPAAGADRAGCRDGTLHRADRP